MKPYLLATLLLGAGSLSLCAQIDSTTFTGAWTLIAETDNSSLGLATGDEIQIEPPRTADYVPPPDPPSPPPDPVWTFDGGWCYRPDFGPIASLSTAGNNFGPLISAHRYYLLNDGDSLVLAGATPDTLSVLSVGPDTLRFAQRKEDFFTDESYLDTLTFLRNPHEALPPDYRTFVQQTRLGNLRLDGLYEARYTRDDFSDKIELAADETLAFYLRFYPDTTVLANVAVFKTGTPPARRCPECNRSATTPVTPLMGVYPFECTGDTIRFRYDWQERATLDWQLTLAADGSLQPAVHITVGDQTEPMERLVLYRFVPVTDLDYYFATE